MSQPRNYGPGEADPLAYPLKNIEQLIEVFINAERKKDAWLMGVEYEIFGQINNGLSPVPYEGNISITKLFSELAQKTKAANDPLMPIIEGDYIVALSCKRAIIALEPGGQIEIAARPHARLLDVTKSFTDIVKEIEETASSLGIALFALGIHPWAQREDMALVKKARYGIMRNYMGGLAGLGLDMMTRSCALQINLDYENERDMVVKTRLGAALMPFYSLLCASVAFIDGKPAKHAIERGHVWRMTDKNRTGIPAIIFNDDFGYLQWINMALDVPMYFIRRDEEYIDLAGASFRDFMSKGQNGHVATVRDFVDHLTTIFTEVRLKPILELRSPDSLPVPFANALFALTWALFYDDKARARAEGLFDGLTHKELQTLHYACIDQGSKAEFRGQPVFLVAGELLAIAEEFFKKESLALNEPSLKEILQPLISLAERGQTFAEWIKEHFSPFSEQKMPALVKAFAPFNNPIGIASR